MADLTVRTRGIPESKAFLAKLADASTSVDKGVTGAGTKKIYAYGIEYGVTRSGRLARKAGGVHYMREALRKHAPGIPDRLAKALSKGKHEVDKTRKDIANDIADTAKQKVVVRTGALRGSIYPIYPGSATPADEGQRSRTPRSSRGNLNFGRRR